MPPHCLRSGSAADKYRRTVTDTDSHSAPGAPGAPSPSTPAGSGADDKGIGVHLNELLALVIGYAKQETIGPLKSLGRYVAWGVAGAVLFATGGGLLTLTAVRVVQAETGHHLKGNLTWVPYLGGVIVAGAGVAWAGLRVVRGDRALKVPTS